MKKSEELKAQYDKLYEIYREDRAADKQYVDFYDLQMQLRKLKEKIEREERREVEVGDGVTLQLFSDRQAYTVIRRTPKTITIQRDKVTLSRSFKPEFVTGGFVAHCTNQDEQSYSYEQERNGSIEVCYWSEKNGCFMWHGCCPVRNGRHEFYDYNF